MTNCDAFPVLAGSLSPPRRLVNDPPGNSGVFPVFCFLIKILAKPLSISMSATVSSRQYYHKHNLILKMESWACADQAAGDMHGESRMLALCSCNLSSSITPKFLIFLGAEAGHYEAGEIKFTKVAS